MPDELPSGTVTLLLTDAGAALREQISYGLGILEAGRVTKTRESAMPMLGEEEFMRAFDEGAQLDLDEAAALARFID